MSVDLSFGQVMTALSKLYSVPPEKLPAFSSRVKHLQKLGLPMGERPGRGKVANYTFRQFYQLVVALELQQRGFTPQLSAHWTAEPWHLINYSLLSTTDPHNLEDESDLTSSRSDYVWVYQFDAFVEPPVARNDEGKIVSVTHRRGDFLLVSFEDFLRLLKGEPLERGHDPGELRETFVAVRGSQIVKRAIEVLAKDLSFASMDAVRDECDSHRSELGARLNKLIEAVTGDEKLDGEQLKNIVADLYFKPDLRERMNVSVRALSGETDGDDSEA